MTMALMATTMALMANLNLSLEPEEDLNFLTLPDKIMAMVGPCLVRKGLLLR